MKGPMMNDMAEEKSEAKLLYSRDKPKQILQSLKKMHTGSKQPTSKK